MYLLVENKLEAAMIRTALAATAFIGFASAAAAGEAVPYEDAGMRYEGYFAPAQGEAKGLVVVIHDWDGLTDYERRRADMLAELGYDAFALDLYGAENRPQSVAENRAATQALYGDRETMRSRLLAGLGAAREASDLTEAVVMGYCFGGSATLELARSGRAENVVGYATFHGGLATPEGQSWPDGAPPVFIAHGGADQSIPIDEAAGLAEALEAKGIPYELAIYAGAPHGFTEFGTDRYQEVADQRSWAAFQALLDRTFGDEG
jgi:dienelactone hydrolase